MTENKSATGYPSIDKPWLKYYSDEAIKTPLPETTIYEYMFNCNTEHMERSAINYFGKHITYKKLFDNITSATKALASIGVKKGDSVALCMLSMPETVYAVYGLNRLGAIANIIEPRTNPGRIRDRINEAGAKVLVVVNVFLNKIIEIASETPLSHPMNARERIFYHSDQSFEPHKRADTELCTPIIIGNNVWIAAGAIICPGVTIGDNTVIGAGSLVTKDIPAGVVAFGSPCRVVRPAADGKSPGAGQTEE